jgi:hypothetical protein
VILICGIPSEPPVALVAEAAQRAGVETIVLNQRESAWADLTVEFSGGRASGSLGYGHARYDLDACSGVFVRLMDWRALPECRIDGRRYRDPATVERTARFNELLQEWIEWTAVRVMNRMRASASNGSKPYQSRVIREAGFRVPETLVTNDADEVVRFARENGLLIYKSISSVRSIVRSLDDQAMQRLERVRFLPTQFQRRIDGTDVRVHVVADELFATEVRSQAMDYRYASRDGDAVAMMPVELPADVRDRCFALAHRLDLALCGIDLRRGPDGEWFCFEANPSPAFSWYQDQTGQPIADAIVRHLRPKAA